MIGELFTDVCYLSIRCVIGELFTDVCYLSIRCVIGELFTDVCYLSIRCVIGELFTDVCYLSIRCVIGELFTDVCYLSIRCVIGELFTDVCYLSIRCVIGELFTDVCYLSIRCVIGELFTDGTAPFDLSELLAYRSGEFTPKKLLQKIPDSSIRVRFHFQPPFTSGDRITYTCTDNFSVVFKCQAQEIHSSTDHKTDHIGSTWDWIH